MYLLLKVRQLIAQEITQAETHSLKSLNKTLPGRRITAQSGIPAYYTEKITDVFLLPIVKKTHKKTTTTEPCTSYD